MLRFHLWGRAISGTDDSASLRMGPGECDPASIDLEPFWPESRQRDTSRADPTFGSPACSVSGTRSGTPGGEVDVCVTADHDSDPSAAGDGADPIEPGSCVVAA